MDDEMKKTVTDSAKMDQALGRSGRAMLSACLESENRHCFPSPTLSPQG